ncbi:lipopolysaccharide biosynthesis protein [Paraburkholderia sp. J10-1]|uniref:lipopolysaccharide biosynthesis protein n=1 Tax=Paraburkholderia sp. J10-1 TaxID=2805430 RepID=UPI002AB7D813|nr:oligosaccharide flippase family protein [Paraburkholderia sp. J10-1]
MSLVGGVLSLTIYARILGPQTYGRLAVYLALIEAFQGVCFQWHRLALVRYWDASGESEADSYLVTSHVTWIVIALVGTVGWLVALLLLDGSRVEWAMVAIVALAKSAALYAQEIARVSGAVLRYALASLLLTVGATLAGIAAWSTTHSMSLTLCATAAIFVLQTALCAYDRIAAFQRAHFEMAKLRTMLRYGLPLVPVFLATTALTRIDRPILSAFNNAEVVGIYAAASGLVTNAISAACLLVVTPAYPWLLRERMSRSESGHRTLHSQIGSLTLAGMLAICITFFLARDIALPLLLGHAIGVAAEPLVFPLLTIAVISAFRMHFFDQAYHLHAQTRILMMINISTLFVAVCAVYIGARFGGLRGLLTGLLIANVFSLGVSAMFARALVDMKRIMTSGILLVGIAGVAAWCGSVSRFALTHLPHSNVWGTCISTVVGIVLFAGMYFGGNIGSIRCALKGRL